MRLDQSAVNPAAALVGGFALGVALSCVTGGFVSLSWEDSLCCSAACARGVWLEDGCSVFELAEEDCWLC